MQWIVFSLALLFFASGSLVASSTAPPPQESEQTEPDDEDFIPTEKVPADSAISFPVDI